MGIASAIADLAPTLGAAFGGPVGTAIGGAARQLIKGVFNLPEQASDDEIEQAIATASPEQLVELRKADMDFKKQMAQLGVDMEKIHAADRDSARKRQAETKDKVPAILAAVLLLGFFGILGYILLEGLPEAGGEAILLLLGALAGAFGQVVNFYFGSSSGSSKKNELIAKMKGA